MSEILQMQFFPILNSTDLYKHFDILDMLRSREAFARLVNGHFRWSRSINLHHLDVILAMTDTDNEFQMDSVADYWAFRGDWSDRLFKSINQYEELPEYAKQAEAASLIYEKYCSKLKGKDSKIIMLVIAGILLAGKDEKYLAEISAEQLKKAYECVENSSDADNSNNGTIIDIYLDNENRSIALSTFHGTYRIFMDSGLQPSHEKRLQTYIINADADVDLEFFDTRSGEAEKYKLLMGEQIYALGIDGMISRILPNHVTNGSNTMIRQADGIYLNGKKCFAIPDGVSSFAVGMSSGVPQFIYVKDGHIHYGNYDNLEGKQKVSEEIAVISEVRIKESEVIVIRNDGKIWDGKKFC